MTPQLLAFSFVIGSILLTWTIRVLGDWLYPPPRPWHASQPARTVRDSKDVAFTARNWRVRTAPSPANAANSFSR